MAEELEYLWVENNLPSEPCRVFNFGSRNCKTVERFIKKGYTVVGVDLEEDTRNIYPNYEFHQGNFLEMTFDEKFKFIYAVCSIEHVGLWGINDLDGDKKAVKKLYSMLKPDGMLLITVPYGETYPVSKMTRVYNKVTLSELVKGLHASIKFFIAIDIVFMNNWKNLFGIEPSVELQKIAVDYKPINRFDITNHTALGTLASVACIKVTRLLK